MKFEKEMLIGDIVRTGEEAVKTLLSCGMHCLGCPSSQRESLEEACMVHGIDVNAVLDKLNEDK